MSAMKLIKVGRHPENDYAWRLIMAPNSEVGYKKHLRVLMPVMALLLVVSSTSRSAERPYRIYGENIISENTKTADTESFGRHKPSVEYIKYDLIGHKLSEGVMDGYHKADWTYTIDKSSISSFVIERILVDDSKEYLIVASLRLYGGLNYYYDTKVRISYMDRGRGWELQYVQSLGMTVVSDGRYDDFVRYELVDDGWGGVKCLRVRNLSECSLVVGGYIRNYDGWVKFSCPVGPHEISSVGGTFSGGSVSDYKISFVVREK